MKHPSIKTVIIIAGPTAAGKSAVAIELARHFQTEIISADSRQCFKELNIGVARPGKAELDQVPHHFMASHSISDNVSAVTFEQYALQKINDLFGDHDVVLMVGGTGLYIKAFCEGLDEIPAVKPGIRENIIKQYEEKGLEWLQESIRDKDPLFYEQGEMQNPQRLMRALEVAESTGRSIFSFRDNKKIKRDFNFVKIGLELPREELIRIINSRVEKMMEKGLLQEVNSLLPFKKLNALQTVGYVELFDHLDGKLRLDEAIERMKINTRQYAKRQMTWFRKDPEIKWFNPGELQNIKDYLENWLLISMGRTDL